MKFQQNSPHSEFDQSWSASAISPSFKGTSSLTTSGWIRGTMELQINNVVRATCDLKPAVDATAQLSSSSNAAVTGTFDVTIGGGVGLKLAGVSIPPQANLPDQKVYSYNKQIWHA